MRKTFLKMALCALCCLWAACGPQVGDEGIFVSSRAVKGASGCSRDGFSRRAASALAATFSGVNPNASARYLRLPTSPKRSPTRPEMKTLPAVAP